MTLRKELEQISHDDNRHTFTDFSDTFELHLFWSDANLIKTINHVDQGYHDFIKNAVIVYREHTKKYEEPQKTLKSIAALIDLYHHKYGLLIDIRDLERSTGLRHLILERNLQGKVTRNLNDIYDTLRLGLIKRKKEDIFNSLQCYKHLERKIMQAQVAQGKTIISINKLAEHLGINSDLLLHPEKICRTPRLFISTIIALDSFIEDQVRQSKYFQSKTTRLISGLEEAIETKPFVNGVINETGLTFPEKYNIYDGPGFFVKNEDLPIIINNYQRRRKFFTKATAKHNQVQEVKELRRKQEKHPRTLTITRDAFIQVNQIAQYMHVNRSTLIDYFISKLNENTKVEKKGYVKYQNKRLVHEPISVSLSDSSFLRLETIAKWQALSPGELLDYIIDEIYLEWLKYRLEIRKKSIRTYHQYSRKKS